MAEDLPAISDLSEGVMRELCVLLDLPGKHNWKKLLEHVKNYTHMDVMELSNLAQQGLSPSRELLTNLNGQGWTILELAQAARKAGIMSVVRVLSDFCAEEGIEVDLTRDHTPDPSSPGGPNNNNNWLGAKSCLHRSPYSTDPAPPTGHMEEAYRRYGMPHPPPAAMDTRSSLSTSGESHSGSSANQNGETLNEISQACGQSFFPESSSTLSSTGHVGQTSNGISQDSQDSGQRSQISAASSSETSSRQQSTDHVGQTSLAIANQISQTSSQSSPDSLATRPLSCSRYNSTSSSSTIEVPAGLEEVGYGVLLEATRQFDQTPYREGGHKVGEGGFGEVFQCSLVLQKGRIHAAVKVLLNQTDACGSETSAGSVDSVDRQQFSTETQALSRLSHECLLPILAYSCDGPRLCLVYPFMSNGSLEAHLGHQTTLPPPRRLRITRDVASALHYLHTMSEGAVVHRDVKSANILLSKDWRGKLGDFGLARVMPTPPSSSQQLTSMLTATIVGTHVYMAPETRGGTITPAADVYAFGVVLYELLTGRSALSKMTTEDGEDTDLLTYLEEYEGEREDLLVGGPDTWDQATQEQLWDLADRCILKRKKRPSSSEVFHLLEDL